MLARTLLPLALATVVVAQTEVVITCPTSNGTFYATDDGMLFQIDCYIDPQGDDMSIFNVDTFNDCIAACDNTMACMAVSYVPGSGLCYLKSDVGTPSLNGQVWAAEAYTPPVTTTTTRKTTSKKTGSTTSTSQKTGSTTSTSKKTGSTTSTSKKTGSTSKITSSKTSSSKTPVDTTHPVFRYDACFAFSVAQPPLNLHPAVANLTLEQCAYTCTNHTMFGVANLGTKCFCGNVTSNPMLPDSSCFNSQSFKCKGDSTELCGAAGAMPVFAKVSSIGSCTTNTAGTTYSLCKTITGSNSKATALVTPTAVTAARIGAAKAFQAEQEADAPPSFAFPTLVLAARNVSTAPESPTTTSVYTYHSTNSVFMTGSMPSVTGVTLTMTSGSVAMASSMAGASSSSTMDLSFGGAGRSGTDSSSVPATGLGPVMTMSASMNGIAAGRSGSASVCVQRTALVDASGNTVSTFPLSSMASASASASSTSTSSYNF